jgi:uncharacterized LabA/DUF88 family protein
VQNIYYPAKSLGDKVNFHSLLKRFAARQLVRAIAYVVEAPDVDVTPFVIALRNIGFEVRTKPMRIFDDGTRKGDIHLMLALDALSVADKVDVVCLVTGDGEYVDLVHLLRGRGIKVEVMSFKSNTSSELLRVSDEHIPMNEEFLLGHGGGRGEERLPERSRGPADERLRPASYRGPNGRDPRPALGPRRDDRYAPRPLRDDRFGRDERLPREDRSYREDRPYRDERAGREERLPLRPESRALDAEDDDLRANVDEGGES